jgi:hypothetical protein
MNVKVAKECTTFIILTSLQLLAGNWYFPRLINFGALVIGTRK